MTDPTRTPAPVTPDILAVHGLTVPAEEQPALLATLASMRLLADQLYAVDAARYEDPAIGWAARS